MAALITVSNSDGVVGRCDAKCYAAQHAECDCICGGINHGAGLEGARENLRELVLEPALERFAAENGYEPGELTAWAQSDLFPFGNDLTTREKKKLARRSRHTRSDHV